MARTDLWAQQLAAFLQLSLTKIKKLLLSSTPKKNDQRNLLHVCADKNKNTAF